MRQVQDAQFYNLYLEFVDDPFFHSIQNGVVASFFFFFFGVWFNKLTPDENGKMVKCGLADCQRLKLGSGTDNVEDFANFFATFGKSTMSEPQLFV